MRKYLETLLEEKNIDLETSIEVMGASGINYMTVETVVEAIAATSKYEQEKIKHTLVQIDFRNGDVMHFINHLAKALAV